MQDLAAIALRDCGIQDACIGSVPAPAHVADLFPRHSGIMAGPPAGSCCAVGPLDIGLPMQCRPATFRQAFGPVTVQKESKATGCPAQALRVEDRGPAIATALSCRKEADMQVASRRWMVLPGHQSLWVGVTWPELKLLLEELGKERTSRLSYSHGMLEIMAPSFRHEDHKEILVALSR